MRVLKPSRSLVGLCAAIAVGIPMPTDAQADDLDIYRRRVSNEFTASADAIAFSVVLARDTSGLVVIDRKTGRQRLIADNKIILVGPRFSQDGQRLLFVRNQASSEDRELVHARRRAGDAAFSCARRIPSCLPSKSIAIRFCIRPAQSPSIKRFAFPTGASAVTITIFICSKTASRLGD